MREHHVLVVHTQEALAYILEARVCSVGRDEKNAIVLNKSYVSRQHAMFLRVPTTHGGYSYQLIDGNLEGTPSSNGTFVNGKRCSSSDLETGDLINFGPNLRATYMIIAGTKVNLERYLEAQQIHSIKEDPLNTEITEIVSYKGKRRSQSNVADSRSTLSSGLAKQKLSHYCSVTA